MLQYKFGTSSTKGLNDWLRGSQLVNITSDKVLHIYGEHNNHEEFEAFITWEGDEKELNAILAFQTLFFIIPNQCNGSYWIVVENIDGNPYSTLIVDKESADYIGIEPLY